MYRHHILDRNMVSIRYSGKFSKTICFAVFTNFTSTLKINSLKNFEHAACISVEIDCFTHVVINMSLYKRQASSPDWIIIFVIIIICHCCSQWSSYWSNGLRIVRMVNTQSILPYCKNWIIEVCCSAWNIGNLKLYMALNLTMWLLASDPGNLICEMFCWRSTLKFSPSKITCYMVYIYIYIYTIGLSEWMNMHTVLCTSIYVWLLYLDVCCLALVSHATTCVLQAYS